MEQYFSCAVRWKEDGKNGPVWHTESWITPAISVSDAETKLVKIAGQEDLPQFEVRSASPITAKRIVALRSGDAPESEEAQA